MVRSSSSPASLPIRLSQLCFFAHLLLSRLGRGLARFVNIRDDHGATPLHLAARQGRPGCLQVLLENDAIVSALIGSYGYSLLILYAVS